MQGAFNESLCEKNWQFKIILCTWSVDYKRKFYDNYNNYNVSLENLFETCSFPRQRGRAQLFHEVSFLCMCDVTQGFFRRSIQQKIHYRPCLKNQLCLITRVNRNRCQYCRFASVSFSTHSSAVISSVRCNGKQTNVIGDLETVRIYNVELRKCILVCQVSRGIHQDHADGFLLALISAV
jgi:hypothetical protein